MREASGLHCAAWIALKILIVKRWNLNFSMATLKRDFLICFILDSPLACMQTAGLRMKHKGLMDTQLRLSIFKSGQQGQGLLILFP